MLDIKMTQEEFQNFLFSELILLDAKNKALIEILLENNLSIPQIDEKISKYIDSCGKKLEERIKMNCTNLEN